MSDTYNNRARVFLEKHNFSCEPEPRWVVAGRKPDFFCTGPFDLWVEAKSLPIEERYEAVYRIFEYLLANQHKVTGRGFAIAHASSAATLKDAKVALSFANSALAQPEAAAHKAVWVVIPENPDYKQRVTFAMQTKDGPVWLVSSKSSTGGYGYPFHLEPEPWEQEVALHDQDGTVAVRNLDDIAEQERYRFALAIYPDDKPFRLLSTGPAGLARESGNRKRIRDAMRDAVNQLKNGIRYREAPACVFIFQDDLMVPEEIEILSALLGDLVYRFKPRDFQHGELGFAGGASWHASQNTSISAITYFRNKGIPTTVHNPYAARPLQPGVFSGRECFIDISEAEFAYRIVEHPESDA